MGWATDWLGMLLRCDVTSGPRLFLILLGAVASTVTITVGVRKLLGPRGPLKRAALVLRDEGEARFRRGDWRRAMELYNLSILANPHTGHVYYLRGLIQEQRGQLNRAITDWRRCVARLPSHGEALAKLAEYHRSPPHHGMSWRVAAGAIALVVVLTCAGLFLSRERWTAIAEFITQAN
jgi:tetratricopeptide (TPR) repeat protein